MSTPPHEAHFFGLRVPSGQPFNQLGKEKRPEIIRRLECFQCPHLVRFMYPTDEQGNPLPAAVCGILDIENAKIQEENMKRHPTEQLLYGNCVYGPIPEPPYFPHNVSDIIPR